jgi:hypothetical protein
MKHNGGHPMKYSKLRTFLKEHNDWQGIFNPNHRSINLHNMTQKDADDIAAEIDCRLSPENLHCDGEISVAEANRKYIKLSDTANDLFKFCDDSNLKRPTIWEM